MVHVHKYSIINLHTKVNVQHCCISSLHNDLLLPRNGLVHKEHSVLDHWFYRYSKVLQFLEFTVNVYFN